MAPDTTILSADELASIRRDYRAATLLPARAYQDAGIHDWERRHILRRDWIPVGRAEEAPEPGSYFLTEIDGDQLIVIRGRDDVLRAFHNVCRHRGTAVAEDQCGKVVRLQCPYHAWIYDLDGSLIRAKHTDGLEDFSFDAFGLVGVRCEVWQGFVFLNLDPDAAPLVAQLGDLVEHLGRFDFGALRSAKRIDYEVGSNWKFIAENYSECHHCPGLHPQLNRLTPLGTGVPSTATAAANGS
jgi:Rieske 2Fe-2S family protein